MKSVDINKIFNKSDEQKIKIMKIIIMVLLSIILIFPISFGIYVKVNSFDSDDALVTANTDLWYYLNDGTTDGGKPIYQTITYQLLDSTQKNIIYEYQWNYKFFPRGGGKPIHNFSNKYIQEDASSKTGEIGSFIDEMILCGHKNDYKIVKNTWNNYTVFFYFDGDNVDKNEGQGDEYSYITVNVYKKHKSRCYEKKYLFWDSKNSIN